MKPFLVVGHGSIGRRHFQNLKALIGQETSVLVYDPHARDRGIFFINNFDEIKQDGLSAALICTPNHIRSAVIEPLIEKGVRYFFIEKPIAHSIEEGRHLGALLKSHKCYGFIGCNLRFHKAVSALKEALAQGKIGRPLYARSTFSHFLPNWRPNVDYRKTYSAQIDEGGGVVLDAIHEPDYLGWLFGRANVRSKFCTNTNALEIETEDLASYVLEHENGCMSEVFVDYLRVDKLRKCEIIGEKGTLEWCSHGKNPEKVTVKFYNAQHSEVLLEDKAYEPNEQYIEEMRYFIKCVREGAEPMNGPKEAQRNLEITEEVKA